MKARYIPNALSLIRILMAFAFAAVFVWLPDKLYIAVIIFVFAGLTDVADGILARRFNWISDAGKILDPLADKLMQLTALVCLFVSEIAPRWLLAAVVLKEIIMGVGSVIFYRRFKIIGVSENYGKAYTVLFYVVVASLIVFEGWFSANEWVKYVLCTATALSGFAAIVLYYITYLKGKLFKKNKEKTPTV